MSNNKDISTNANHSQESNNNIIKKEENIHAVESLSSAEKTEIINQFQKDLKNIDITQITIERIATFARDKIYRYGDAIMQDLFQILDLEVHLNPCLGHLYVINDIIQNIFIKKKYEKIKEEVLATFFPFIKSICIFSYLTLDENIQNGVKFLLKIWQDMSLFPSDWIKELNFELKMNSEPEITDDKEEIDFLLNLVNNGSFRIDQNLIDYSKEIEALERTNDNKHRKNLLKMDKDLINKQLRLYNNHIQNLKDLNLLLNRIKIFEDEEQKQSQNNVINNNS